MPSFKPLNWSSPGAGIHPMKGGGGAAVPDCIR